MIRCLVLHHANRYISCPLLSALHIELCTHLHNHIHSYILSSSLIPSYLLLLHYIALHHANSLPDGSMHTLVIGVLKHVDNLRSGNIPATAPPPVHPSTHLLNTSSYILDTPSPHSCCQKRSINHRRHVSRAAEKDGWGGHAGGTYCLEEVWG